VRRPKALVYAERMTAMLARFVADASEALELSARCQHIERWKIPRNEYPMTRAGYQQWRARLRDFHADRAAAILRDAGYDDATIARVGALVRKERMKSDPGGAGARGRRRAGVSRKLSRRVRRHARANTTKRSSSTSCRRRGGRCPRAAARRRFRTSRAPGAAAGDQEGAGRERLPRRLASPPGCGRRAVLAAKCRLNAVSVWYPTSSAIRDSGALLLRDRRFARAASATA
jgi:hypothetical protein